jgi:hypothetical protein
MVEFEEPGEDKWPAIIDELLSWFSVSSKVVKGVFTACCDGVKNPEKKGKGGGRKHKLKHDNAGLIVGAAALSLSVAPRLAAEICNVVNQQNHPNKF